MSFEKITSRQNPYVAYVCKLSEKKHRDREGRFRIDGVKLFREALDFGVELEAVLIMESALDKASALIERLDGKAAVKVLADSVFLKISEEKSPEGVICIAKHIDKLHKIATINNSDEKYAIGELENNSIFIVESVRDPGNLGTIIRTSAAFGVDCLMISSDCADIYNPKTLRAAMGTIFHQRILKVDRLPEVVRLLSQQDRRIYAATLGRNAKLLGKISLDRRDCIVVGNEGHGLSEKVIEACGEKILIPMAEGTESLNAAIAASVCLWEQFGRNQ